MAALDSLPQDFRKAVKEASYSTDITHIANYLRRVPGEAHLFLRAYKESDEKLRRQRQR